MRLPLAVLAWVLVAGCASVASPPKIGYPVPAGQSFRDGPDTPELVVLPPGRFVMGSTEAETQREQRAAEAAATERPQREVVFDAPLAVGRFHVTVAEFDRFVRATGRTSVFNGCTVDDHGRWSVQADRSFRNPQFAQGQDHPAVCVTWSDARAYADWLTQRTGHAYRLLREAEWEYAARAGTTTARWWGDGVDAMCTHANGADQRYGRDHPGDAQTNPRCDDGFAATSPVATYPANPFGLHDVLGNAWQWVDDCFRPRHDAPPVPDTPCERRVVRGGSWHNATNVLRSASRFGLPSELRSSSVGFRMAREPDRAAARP